MLLVFLAWNFPTAGDLAAQCTHVGRRSKTKVGLMVKLHLAAVSIAAGPQGSCPNEARQWVEYLKIRPSLGPKNAAYSSELGQRFQFCWGSLDQLGHVNVVFHRATAESCGVA